MNVGDLILLQLVDKEEIMGEYIGEEDDFYRIAKAAQILIFMTDAPDQQPHPQRTIVPVEDKGNFEGTMQVARDKVLFIKSIVEGSGVYNIYKQAVTGLIFPQADAPKSGLVLPFIRPPGRGDGRGGVPSGGMA